MPGVDDAADLSSLLLHLGGCIVDGHRFGDQAERERYIERGTRGGIHFDGRLNVFLEAGSFHCDLVQAHLQVGQNVGSIGAGLRSLSPAGGVAHGDDFRADDNGLRRVHHGTGNLALIELCARNRCENYELKNVPGETLHDATSYPTD